MPENVTLQRDGPIATVTLNRPDFRNSLSDGMLTDLADAFAELRDDPATRVVVLTGAPPVFSAGAHAPFKKGMTDEERRVAFANRRDQFRRLFERAVALLENLEQVTICSINGVAAGGGWGLTLGADFRIAADSAVFWLPEVDLGTPLGVGSTTRFVRLVGPARAKEIILTCRRYSAAELLAMGLVHQVVPLDQLQSATDDFARMLAAKPFKALAECKARVNAISRVGTPEVNAMTEGFLDRS